jgi:hypothetical protein
MIDLETTHERLTQEITESRQKQVKEFVAAKRQRQEREAASVTEALKRYKAIGLDVTKLEALNEEHAKRRAGELDEVKKKYAAKANEPKVLAPADFRATALAAAVAPAEARHVPPAWAAVFSTKDPDDKLSGGTGTDVFNYNILDAWDWASGGGNGWFGSGAGEYQVWCDWGYWYHVPTSKFYGITTHDQFRGYYIVRSFDDWWISAHSRVVVSMWTNVWQYNWKGWTNVNVLDVGGDNIDVNQRFDTDRHFYSTALLAGGDWAFVQSTIGLYVYARAGGSYSELNFAVGAATYLAAPHVHIV